MMGLGLEDRIELLVIQKLQKGQLIQFRRIFANWEWFRDFGLLRKNPQIFNKPYLNWLAHQSCPAPGLPRSVAPL